MTRSRTPTYIAILGFLLLVAIGRSQAHDTGPWDPTGRATGGSTGVAPLGTGFTYQGRLQDSAGNPISDTCDLAFSLWPAASGGNQVGDNCAARDVQVRDGYFTVILNAGNEFGPSAFLGDARWLQIAVKCSSDAGFAILNPRQAITPAPYALSLRPGSAMVGQVPGDASMLWVGNQAPSGYASALYGESASTGARAVRGIATASSGATSGLYGQANSTGGTGVTGVATAGSGAAYGVLGVANSARGRGVSGLAPAQTGENYGLYGQSNSSNGRGVYGYVLASSGESFGVYGQSNSSGGRGVYGYVPAVSGETHAVFGRARSPDGTGVRGIAEATSGRNYGLYASTNSADGYGGYMRNTAGGTALYVDGDAVQSRAGDGLVKAAVYVSCRETDVEVHRYFNAVNGRLSASNVGTGWCRLDFDFSLNDRFWTTSSVSTEVGGCAIVQCFPGLDDQLNCQMFRHTGGTTTGSFMLIVY